jgi:hypothetical protein
MRKLRARYVINKRGLVCHRLLLIDGDIILINTITTHLHRVQQAVEHTADAVVRDQVQALLRFSHIDDPPAGLPPARTLELDIRDAARFRKYLDDTCPTEVCGACSMYCGPASVQTYSLTSLPHLELLAADGPHTPELPRHAHTTVEHPVGSGRRYCLQPAACGQLEDGSPGIRVCDICIASLRRRVVPPASLVRFDAGAIPTAPNLADQLVPLRAVEAQLVAQIHVARLCIVMRPVHSGSRRALDTMQVAQRGHVIAFPNVDISLVRSALPMPIEQLPDILQVIFVCKAASPEEVRQLARNARCLQIRGKEVAKWARYLYEVRGHAFRLCRQIAVHIC